MVVGLCQRFHSLPEAGGVLDQDVSLVRMLKMVDLAHREEGQPGAQLG